jgi:ferredoxin/flavodoxin
MNKKYALYYFSGTGNTEFVVKLLAEELAKVDAAVDLFKIETLVGEKTIPDLDAYETVGFAHPVLGFDTPGLVYDFVRALPTAAGKPSFILKTAGDFHAVNNGASKSLIGILARKGYTVFYDELFAMPCNWLMSLDDQLSRELVEAARAKIPQTACRIAAGEVHSLRIGFFLRWAMKACGIMEDQYGAKYFGQYLRTTDACTLCGTCVKHCPVSNISEVDKKIRFGKKCIWCMRCIYSCPRKAIYNKYMNFFILKGGYSLRRILNLPRTPINFAAPRLSTWHAYYREYFRGLRLPGD